MLENFTDSSTMSTEDLHKMIDAERSAWETDNEVEKILHKKRKKIKRLKKKIKKGHGSKKKCRKKMKALKKQLKTLRKDKKQQEYRLKTHLLQVRHQNDMLRIFIMLQMNGGKEYFMKQILKSNPKMIVEDYQDD